MIKFGPSGNSKKFFEDGNKISLQAPAWLKKIGLEAYEYSFGKGYTMSMETAQKLGEEAKKYNIQISIHAPYYINFANTDELMKEKSFNYVLKGLEYVKAMKGTRLVFHIASQGKMKRENALNLVKERLEELLSRIDFSKYNNIYLCPETMGKQMQIGTYQEIVDLCTLHEKLMPTFDFGHINALTGGGLKTKADYIKIFEYSFAKLGENRTKNCQIHFSKIKYGEKGEICHLDLSDTIYGPEFAPLAEAICELNLTPTIICESKELMAEDALILKNIYQNIKNK